MRTVFRLLIAAMLVAACGTGDSTGDTAASDSGISTLTDAPVEPSMTTEPVNLAGLVLSPGQQPDGTLPVPEVSGAVDLDSLPVEMSTAMKLHGVRESVVSVFTTSGSLEPATIPSDGLIVLSAAVLCDDEDGAVALLDEMADQTDESLTTKPPPRVVFPGSHHLSVRLPSQTSVVAWQAGPVIQLLLVVGVMDDDSLQELIDEVGG